MTENVSYAVDGFSEVRSDDDDAGADCTVSMFNTKRSNYASHEEELMAEGIRYLPVVWSAYGRPHPDASRVLLTLARNTARRRGEASYRGLARRWSCKITAAIWRRAANMVLSCWPASTAVGA